MTLKAGVIGLGVGEAHVAGYQANADIEVVAICDFDERRLREIGERYGVSNRHTNWRAITEDPEIDVVSICSYDDGHAKQGIDALRNGKHCMIEKPVVLNRSEAEALLREQQQSGKRLTSNLILRHSPRFAELRRRIQAGALGKIAYMEGDYLHDIEWKITTGWRGQMEFYCVVFGGGIHLIDLMRWLSGAEVTHVSGMSNKVFTSETGYRFDDLYVNLLQFDNGAIAKTTTTLSPKRPKFHAVSVYGTLATFVNGPVHAEWFDGDDESNRHLIETPYHPKMAKDGLLADFVAAVRENREPIVSARDVFRVMDVCFACREAAASGQSQSVHYLM